MLAFPNAQGDVFALTPETLAEGFEASRNSPRRRIILPIHRTQDAKVQRMLNFFQPGTFVRPHAHPQPSHIETIQVIAGHLGFILFETDGRIRETFELEAGPAALVDIEPGLWHGMVCLAENSAILEIKCGPYDGARDKVFAAWAPGENDEGATAYRQKLEAHFESP